MYKTQTKPMRLRPVIARPRRAIVFATMASVLAFAATVLGQTNAGHNTLVPVQAAGFRLGGHDSVTDGTNRLKIELDNVAVWPFTQSAIKQDSEPALYGPNPNKPYFTVRFALPVPPENATNNVAALAGLDPQVFTHNHSPGFEILPNGDALAIYFSTPPGLAEADPATSFIQARLRYGSEDWDLPELFLKTEGYNDQSGLLWNDGGRIRFFGGGRALSDSAPFKMTTSFDNGATWTLSLPQLAQPAENFTAQPITSAFRAPNGAIYFAMDGEGASSLLWRSTDDGVSWRDMGGRTGGRHSVIVPLDNRGGLLSIGGKNNSINGWSPENISTNWGATWSSNTASPFPPLGSAQRPSLIKLADGNLFFVSDAWLQKKDQAPPAGWTNGNGCFVALSTNQGVSWRIKQLPVQLPNHQYRKYGTVGYVTARQAPNGVIHVLTTETQPCLHYELNEAWIFSDAGDIAPEISGGQTKKFTEEYSNGHTRSTWGARLCPDGRYLLNGKETDFYPSGAKQHQVTYVNGRKTGDETFWAPEGTVIWHWSHDLKNNRAVWTQYWPDGKKKLESNWNTKPAARDLTRSFFGLVADGPATQWNEDGTLSSKATFANGALTP
ncbi:MAG TPA: hypothetical protein VG347_00500 [Verrucomicrobiae bacterium]|nr:hypothetical protein [Verrucomicrobiae bacterium]